MLPRVRSTTAEPLTGGPLDISHPPSKPSPTSPPHVSQLGGTKRKQQQVLEAASEPDNLEYVRPFKRLERLPPFEVSEEIPPEVSKANLENSLPPPLSDEDLQTLYKEVIESAAHNSPALKRTSSRRSLPSSQTDTVRSQRSSNTTAYYRYKYLDDANVYINVDPPKDIQAAIDGVIRAKPSEGRQAIIRDEAKKFQERCKEMVRAAAGEDDFLHVFYNVIERMGSDNLMSREKADWRVELKPTTQYLDVNLSFLSDFDAIDGNEREEVDDSSIPPASKRRQEPTGRLYLSQTNSQTNPLDPPQENTLSRPDKAKETSPIKTPRPDITTGIKKSAVISSLASSLSSQDLNYTKTKHFLEKLQDTTMPGRPQESVLIMVPTQRESALTFPALIVEGKAYSTGKQVFEAQNQAAVSGAGGLKIQVSLDELVKRATKDFEPSLTSLKKDRLPLVFSICTEGPYHELWAHYTVIEDDERQFKMVLLDICHGMLLEYVEKFFVRVDNVLNWATGPFLNSVVEDLGKIARKAI
ncbi:MAG: hypothetical protein Q9197_001246 [Variospora fuerteventurae]